MTQNQPLPEIPGAYHSAARQLQDRFDSRRIADRLEQVTVHTTFTNRDRSFIGKSCMFFLATADAQGWPDCSYKGGMPGFVRVVDEQTIAFPDFDGNGMFRSLGNIALNLHVGLLFVDFEKPNRLRVNGLASLHFDDPLLPAYPGAQLIVRVRAERLFPNCPRYIHKMQVVEYSVYVPTHDHLPPEPEWKQDQAFCDALPQRNAPEG
jgi:predicted pyridoxine 5'-phosphate oxidase superfamily flavin-nucleotide-binding protein